MRAPRLEFRMLGPLEVRADGQALPLAAPRARAVLGLLLLHANEPLSSERLIDAVWGEHPPGTARTALHGYIRELRQLLEPNRHRRAAASVLATTPAGYVLRVEDGALDRDRFESLAARGRAELAAGRAMRAADLLGSALDLWHGPALADFAYEEWARGEAERLEEVRLVCTEDRIDAELQLGHHVELVAELEALVEQHPLRERLRRQLMLALYRSGRQAEALEAYRAARRVLVDELGLDPSPEIRELEAAILRQDEALAAPPVPAQPPTNLPAALTELVGRERELAEAEERLLRPDVRLVTLTGAGGAGKTRLAVALAERVLPRFPDGVLLCDLAPVTEPAPALSTIARVLDVRESGEAPLLDGLKSALRERELLLVLDNLEQVVDVGPALAHLLAACPRLTILATSRVPLHLSAEHEYPVGPLIEADASTLFLRRAEAHRPGFRVGADVAEICRRLDRLPLAIELAAARVKVMSPAAILARLGTHPLVGFLTGGARDLPGRQQTLRATLDWSYGLLEEEEQDAFCALGVFPGEFGLDAAADICRVELDLLGSLVDKSLVVRREGDDAPRFALLETVRGYAGEHLVARGSAAELRRRHVAWFLNLAEAAEPNLTGSDQIAWFARLEQEYHNLRAALDFALESDEEVALRLGAVLWRYWFTRGLLSEGRSAMHKVLAPESSNLAARAKALRGAAWLEWAVGEYEPAQAHGEAACALERSLGNDGGVAASLVLLGAAASSRGDFEQALAALEEAVAAARRDGDRRTIATCLNNLAIALEMAGDYERAAAVHREVRPLLHEVGDPRVVANALLNLATAALDGGDHAQAVEALRESLPLHQALGDPRPQLNWLETAARVLAAAGATEPAARLWGAVDAAALATGIVAIAPSERARHEQQLQAARETIRAAAFEAAQAEGRELTLPAALAEASRLLERVD